MRVEPVAKSGDVEGYVWQSKAGHYCWEVRDEEGAISGGGGYETQEDAEAEMLEEFAEQAHRVLH